MIKVLAVDDSALMRRFLTGLLTGEAGFDTRTARDGRDALAQIREFDPDVVTLDVNMPSMDGVTCLSLIMTESPRPVVMVSSLTEKGTQVTLEALALGAVDYIPKPGGTVSLNMERIGGEIIAKVKAAARTRARRMRTRSAPAASEREAPAMHPTPLPEATGAPERVVLIGVSTGGPGTLSEILPTLPANYPFPVVVAQHMGANFTRVLAERLNESCALPVREVQGAVPLAPGMILVARGDSDLILSRRRDRLVALNVPQDERYIWHPSVDRLVTSALEVLPPEQLIGVLLTGMGNDGAASMTRIKKGGGHTVAESEESCVVYGMPRELTLGGGASTVLRADRIGDHLALLARRARGE